MGLKGTWARLTFILGAVNQDETQSTENRSFQLASLREKEAGQACVVRTAQPHSLVVGQRTAAAAAPLTEDERKSLRRGKQKRSRSRMMVIHHW